MKKYLLIIIVSVATILSGCAVKNDETKMVGLGLTYNSKVQQLDSNKYLVEVEASPASGRTTAAVAIATKKAVDFCAIQNKTMKEVRTDTQSNMLVNGVARLTFECQ